jgi:hypothetical protein
MAPFHAWAWAMLACDVAPRLGHPDHWLRQEHLDRMRQRSAFWKRRAGIAA